MIFFLGPVALDRLVGRLYAAAYERNTAVCEGVADDYPHDEVVFGFTQGKVESDCEIQGGETKQVQGE